MGRSIPLPGSVAGESHANLTAGGRIGIEEEHRGTDDS